MNCCDEYGHCNQGRDCPVRTGKPVRKVRAGGPPPEDMKIPIQFWEEPKDPPIWPEVVMGLTLIAAAFGVIFAAYWGWL